MKLNFLNSNKAARGGRASRLKGAKGRRKSASDAYAANYCLALEERQIKEEDKMRLLQRIKRDSGLESSLAYAASGQVHAHPQTLSLKKGRRQVPSLFQLSLATAAGLVLVVGLSLLLLLKPSGQFNPQPQPQTNLPLTLQKTDREKDKGKEDGTKQGGAGSQKASTKAKSTSLSKEKKGAASREIPQVTGPEEAKTGQGQEAPTGTPAENLISSQMPTEENAISQDSLSTEIASLPSQSEPIPGEKELQGAQAPALQLPSSSYDLNNLGVTQFSLVNSGQAIQYANDILVARFNPQTSNWEALSPLVPNVIYEDVMYTLGAGEVQTIDLDLSLFINQPGSYRLILTYNLADDLSGPYNAYSPSFEVR